MVYNEVRSSTELNVLIMMGECFENENYPLSLTLYLYKFGVGPMGGHKLTALNIISRYFTKLLNTNNIHILSDMATIYVDEPGFSDEYKQVCDKIQSVMKHH